MSTTEKYLADLEVLRRLCREIRAAMDDLHFESHRAGIYTALQERMTERTDAGEAASGLWIMETLRALQIEAGLV